MIFEYASEIRDCLIKGKVGTTDRLLYNAEILSKIFMVERLDRRAMILTRKNTKKGCRVDQEPDHAEEELALNPHQLRCTSCNIVKTPEWRKGPLGPRTLCNACGLIWGKLSRSKAALAKSKQESSAKAEPSKSEADVQSTLAGSSGQGAEMPKRPAVDAITLTDIARKKRGRGRSSTRDDNEAQGSATSDTSSSHSPTDNGQSRSQSQQQQQAEDVSMSDGDNPPPTQPSFPSSADLPDTSLKGGCQIDPLSATAPGPVPPPLSPDALPFRTHENHDKEGPAVGRKLTLSYLLA
ncbi:hypothetical protein BGX23_001371 [Mortierella sp. AD031]|nr:hypothetical protein BGX23_001371 [Mortierella sp. AD031]KAG0213619.1 hypothetical protein BGX33_002825 [Mortierella sp. NVP41]